MEPFRYEALNLEVPAFRLLRILQGTADDDIQCELVQAWFNIPESQIPYEALSYTWGSSVKTEEIILDGRSLFVTKNLYAALLHLRLEHQDRVMWIDAICIDQDNVKERGHQVQQMADVYTNATEVVIWLGNTRWQIDILFNALRLVQQESLQYASRDWELTDDRWLQLWSHALQTLGKPEVVARDGLRILLSRLWWKRVWVLQEVANAKAATVLCGSHSVSAKVFALSVLLLKEYPNTQCQAVLDLFPGPSRKYSWWNQERSLRILLHKFRESEASDPRDKIYALLGLSSDAYNTDAMVTDYSKSLDEVILDTVSFLLHFRAEEERLHTLPPGFGPSDFFENSALLNTKILRYAVDIGHESEVKLLLKEGNININSRDTQGRTVLYTAAMRRHRRIVNLLLVQDDVEANPKENSGRTLLSRLTKTGDIQTITALLQHSDVSVYSYDSDGRTSLWYAIERGHAQLVKLFLDREGLAADQFNTSLPVAGQTSLTFGHVVEKGSMAVIYALAESLGINHKDEKGQTLLSHAVARGDQSLVQSLLRCENIDPNSQALNGRTPLETAVVHGYIAVAELLLQQHGIDVNIRDHFGCTVLHYAVQTEMCSMIDHLNHSGINVNLQDQFGSTALHWAATKDRYNAIDFLLNNQAININIPDQFGNTALILTAKSNNMAASKRLLVRDDVITNWKDNWGRTTISIAAETSQIRTCEGLLEIKDVDADLSCNSGRTPLSYAASAGCTEVVKLLLKNPRVCADSRDKHGITPLSWAVMGTRIQVVKVLAGRNDVDILSQSNNGDTAFDFLERERQDAVRRGLSDLVFAQILAVLRSGLDKRGIQ